MKPKVKVVKSSLKVILSVSPWIGHYGGGWGNGYVDIPKHHKMYGRHYDDINNYVEVHGGLTYSEEVEGMWRVGFDTVHLGDTVANWPKSKVREEANSLLKQLEILE